jgi:hypothetical protein
MSRRALIFNEAGTAVGCKPAQRVPGTVRKYVFGKDEVTMGTSFVHTCDSCGGEERTTRTPADWADMHIKGGELDGISVLLCRACMARVVSNGPMRTLLERHRAERERGMARRP